MLYLSVSLSIYSTLIETLSNFFKSKFFKEILEYLEFFKILIKISNEKNLDEKKKIILKNSQNYKIQTVQQTTYNNLYDVEKSINSRFLSYFRSKFLLILIRSFSSIYKIVYKSFHGWWTVLFRLTRAGHQGSAVVYTIHQGERNFPGLGKEYESISEQTWNFPSRARCNNDSGIKMK